MLRSVVDQSPDLRLGHCLIVFSKASRLFPEVRSNSANQHESERYSGGRLQPDPDIIFILMHSTYSMEIAPSVSDAQDTLRSLSNTLYVDMTYVYLLTKSD